MSTEAEVVRMLNQMLAYGLLGYDYCCQFPNSVLAEDFNGIGAEWMGEKLRNAFSTIHSDFMPCAFWVSYPKTLSSLNDVSFSSMAAGYPESFATFAESGDISGGFVLGIEPPAGARHTITFGQKIYDCYSAEQISKIEQLLNSKNWTVAW